MSSNTLAVFVFLIFSLPLFAQSDSLTGTSKVSYYNQFIAGGLFAKKGYGSSLSFYTTHGIQYKHMSIGFGLGFDSYAEWRTLPIFVAIGCALSSDPRKGLFIQLNTGFSKVWDPVTQNNFNQVRPEQLGRFFNPMIGYKIKAEIWSIYIMMGYKFHRINYEINQPWWSGKYFVQQDIERMSVQIGFGLH